MQLRAPSCRRVRHASPARPNRSCDRSLVVIANSPLDLIVDPLGGGNGSKFPARIRWKLGGLGGNGSPVARVNDISCHLISVQGEGPLAELCRQLAIEQGLIPLMIERPDEDPAISVSVPSCRKPGERNLHVQRVGPPRLSELAAFADVIASASALIVGPMPIAPGASGRGDDRHAVRTGRDGPEELPRPHAPPDAHRPR